MDIDHDATVLAVDSVRWFLISVSRVLPLKTMQSTHSQMAVPRMEVSLQKV